MGLLIEGVWHDQWYDTKSTGGRFVRSQSAFRNWVTADGASGFPPEAGRYHLYVAMACPWAHRTLIFRKLKMLEDAIGVTTVVPFMGEQGWSFGDRPDPIRGKTHLHQVYAAVDPSYTVRVNVPELYDKVAGTIVSNESSEIIRMFNSAFDAIGDASVDYYPEPLRPAIDEINAVIYDTVNNGVYKSGFATTQAAYDEAVTALFAALDTLEVRLSRQPYLVGDTLTEADWRLFTTLVRFDPVYVGHFKCNIRRLADYPNLWNYTKALYQVPGVAETVDLQEIKDHYYQSHESINPTRIVPVGPDIDYAVPHDRHRFAT